MESRGNGTDEPICRAGIETQMQGMDLWAQMEDGEGGTNCEIRVALKYIRFSLSDILHSV